jgi:hypothetical protein
VLCNHAELLDKKQHCQINMLSVAPEAGTLTSKSKLLSTGINNAVLLQTRGKFGPGANLAFIWSKRMTDLLLSTPTLDLEIGTVATG